MKKFLPVILLCSPFLLSGQAVDSVALKTVDSLIQISQTLSGQQNFAKALEVNTAAEKIALEKCGRESAGYGKCCNNRALVNYFISNYPEAEKWWLEANAIYEKALGKEHPDYARSLYTLAVLYYVMGNYEKAEPLYLETIAICEKSLGKEHSLYAWSLNDLGNLYSDLGNYEKAGPLYLETKTIREKTLGKENPDYAGSLVNLGTLYLEMGQYEKAEPLFLEAKDIFEVRLNNREHPFYINCLGDLALLYLTIGNYEKAEPLFLEAIAIDEKTLGKEHYNHALSLESLGNLYLEMGQYEKAEPLIFEAKAIREKTLGKEHPHYAKSLQNLANLYSKMGEYEKAEPLLLEAIAIKEKMIGKENPDYASGLHSLAALYEEMGAYEKAELLLLEAKAIWEKTIGKEHPDYASSLNNLGNLYFDLGNYEKAERLYLETKTIREKTLGKEHPDYASSLNNLAALYWEKGNYAKAEPLFLEAKAIWEKTIGKEHPDYAGSLSNLATLYERQNRFSASAPLLTELSALEQARLAKSTSFLSEQQLANYTATFQNSWDNLGVYILARSKYPRVGGSQTGTLPALAYSHTLFHKGFLLTAAVRLNTLPAASPESEEIKLRLKGYRRRLAAEYAKPIVERTGVAELEEKATSAEKELARSVAGYAEAARQVNWQEVQAALKNDEAAIEFAHFRVNFPKKTDSTMYAALLLLPGTEQPKFIFLFEEKSLDSLLQSRGPGSERKADYVNNLYTVAGRGVEPIDAPQKSLYELLWQPLEKSLPLTLSEGGGDKPTIYFSPSGLLHRLNLGAIPLPQLMRGKTTGETLADRYRLVELGSTRQLVIPSGTTFSGTEALLYGGIEYDMDSSAIGAAISGLAASLPATRGGLDFANADSTLRGGLWDYLKWTDVEVNATQAILSAAGLRPTVRKGYAGTEESFKSIGTIGPSPRILHLATHGFFFPDPKDNPQSLIRNPQLGEPIFKISDHPMIRAGLILAGGNYAWKTGQPFGPGGEDGILTAYEISLMNLSNTELVVLSACETGLGEIQGNEGVYGLQRAFKIAGAKYLVMSLWQVPDFQTQELMTTFYSRWLEDRMPIPDAFRAAQKAMREKYNSPFFWAGFVLVE